MIRVPLDDTPPAIEGDLRVLHPHRQPIELEPIQTRPDVLIRPRRAGAGTVPITGVLPPAGLMPIRWLPPR